MTGQEDPMSQTADKPKRERVPLNGVDTPNLFATINAVRDQPELAKFQFRATNRWLDGTHSEGKIESFSGAGGSTHASTCLTPITPRFSGRTKLTPVEFLLHGPRPPHGGNEHRRRPA
jgi:hypothetical protein